MSDEKDDAPEIQQEEEKEQSSIIKVNFKDGTIVNKVHYESEGGIPKFLRDMAKFAKQNKVKSVVVMTIDEDNYVDWVHIADSEYHLALAALCVDDIKDDLKATIFGDDEGEE